MDKSGEKRKFRLGRTGRLILIILAAYAVLAGAVSAVVDGRHVRFYMTDAEEITVECGTEFKDPGVYAVTAGRIFGEGEKHLRVMSSGEVDTSTPGEYEVKYSVRYMLKDYSVTRRVIVENSGPRIELKHDENYKPTWMEGYQEEGYTATDAVDGDITDKVERRVEGDKIVYTVANSGGESTSVERADIYSTGCPTLALLGDEQMQVYAGPAFADPGVSAVDAQGNDYSGSVTIDGGVCAYKPGEYDVNYVLTNAVGDSLSVSRHVTVLATALPETITPDERTIYLTFDDGPGPYTDQLLDVLAEYNVKVTFFVTCRDPDNEDAIGRAFSEGHSIGVHTASHNYYDIYSSEDAFFSDFYTAQEMIYNQTGEYTELCRFPGGSSNTVSSFNPGIMSRLAQAVTDMGYKYFDWNVSSGDAGETTDTNTVYQNIIDGCSQHKTSIVLQHDIKDYSVAAVEKVIIWGLKNGYTFRPLDLTSPGSHHAIAN